MARRWILGVAGVGMVASLLVGSSVTAAPAAAAACELNPVIDLVLDVDSADRVYVGQDRIYLQAYETEPTGTGGHSTVGWFTEMYSHEGEYIGRINDFFLWWVDGSGGLWGTHDVDLSDGVSTPQWRSRDGLTAKPTPGTAYFVHDFGGHQWAYDEANNQFHVFGPNGTFITSVEVTPGNSHTLERSGGQPGHHALASSYGNVVAVRQRDYPSDWYNLYSVDGTKIADLAPPAPTPDHNTQGAVVSKDGVYVLDPYYSGTSTLYRYSLGGDYLGTVGIADQFDFSAWGSMPDAGPPAFVVDGTAYWSGYSVGNQSVVEKHKVFKINGANATEVPGLSLSGGPIYAAYPSADRLHVIDNLGPTSLDNLLRAYSTAMEPLGTGNLGHLNEVHTSDRMAFVYSATSGTSYDYKIFESDGSIRAQVIVPSSHSSPWFSFEGTTLASHAITISGSDIQHHLTVWDVTDCPSIGDAYLGRFSDDDGSVFEADIEWIASKGITKGCNPKEGNTKYCPDNYVTRGQMSAFLDRALGWPDTSTDFFIDDDGSLFEASINRMAAAGVTKGCNPADGNDMFCPDKYVTRAQMASFLVRAMGYTDNGGGNLFVDDDGSIHENDIDKLGTAAVTKGCNPKEGNTKYCPDKYVTRGQMAAFLHRALKGILGP